MSQHHDWTYCDGHGGLEASATAPKSRECQGMEVFRTRRQFITTLGLGAAGMMMGRSALAQVAINPKRTSNHVLVSIFLRGGADGLNWVIPVEDPNYYRLRPNLGIAKRDTLALSDQFGLHPAMAPLMPWVRNQQLAFIHACGSPDATRSHFEAMRTMEYGVDDGQAGTGGGWLARYLADTESESTPLRAVAFGSVLPDSLRGSTSAMALQALDQFKLEVPSGAGNEREWIERLSRLYGQDKDELSLAGHETLNLLKTLRTIDPEADTPGGAASYPDSELSRGLRDVATLIRADVGLEVACLDRGAWDTHVAQGTTTGWFTGNLMDVSTSVAAFLNDLGPRSRDVTILIQTEFGRRASENAQLGTDHGLAGVMMVLDHRVQGGKVHGKWPGLKPDELDPVGDLRVATDYRTVLAEVVKARMRPADLKAVFPDFSPEAFDIYRKSV